MAADCSLNGYLNEITKQHEQCLKQHLGESKELWCIAKAALLGARDVAAQCKSVNGVDCSPKGYVVAVIESIDGESKAINIAVKKVSKTVVNSLLPDGVMSAAGCFIGALAGGVGGAFLTRNRIGAQIGAAQGCAWGSKIGLRLSEMTVGPNKVVMRIKETVKSVQKLDEVIEAHSNLCKAKQLTPFDFKAEEIPVVRLNLPPKLNPVIPPAPSVPEIVEEVHEVPMEMPDNNMLNDIGVQLVGYAGQVAGITPAIEEIRQLQEIITTLVENPIDGIQKVVGKYLQTPQSMLKNIISSPKEFLDKGALMLQGEASCMGALAFCGSILSFMSSVTWMVNFIQDPKHMAKALLKMPYTCVKGVIELGVSFIRNPGKTAMSLCRTLIKAPIEIVSGFVRAIRFKKKKKKRKELSGPQVNPQEQQRLFKKYVADLAALYGAAKVNWFIDPYKTIEEYHFDLMADFETLPRHICQNYFDFPSLLKSQFDKDSLLTVREWSPRAHPQETIAPPEVVQIFLEIGKSMVEVEVASRTLNAAHQIGIAVTEELNVERQRLANNVANLDALLNNNEDRLRQALRVRMAAIHNQ
jgi:hypothetical protein